MEPYRSQIATIISKKLSLSTIILSFSIILIGNSCTSNQNSATTCEYNMFEFGCNYSILQNTNLDKFGEDEVIVRTFSDTSYQLVAIQTSDDNVKCATYLDKDWNKDGRYICVSNKNIVLVSGEYSKGQKNSSWKFYSPDGKLKRVQNYYNGKPIGSDYTYNAGGVITRYCMVGGQSECVYLSRYSSNGTVISDVGEPTLLLLKPKSPLRTNEILQLNILTVQAPHLKVRLIEAMGIEDGKIQIDLIRDGIYLITIQFNKPGDHQIKWVMKANKQGEEFTFTKEFTFVVIGKLSDNPTLIGSIE